MAVDAPPLLETPKERTDRRAREIVEDRRKAPVAAPAKHRVTTAAKKPAVHKGRHAFRAGVCAVEGCGACQHCGERMWDAKARDEFGDADPHCIACGARPIRTVAEVEGGSTRAHHAGTRI